MKATIKLTSRQYDIWINRGLLSSLSNFIDSSKKILVLYDANIPEQYMDLMIHQLPKITFFKVASGEESKSIECYGKVIEKLLELQFARSDVIVAFGGGVVGDLAGFAASTYKRGCTFINIPTTTLSMVDSCIGGKTALNVGKVKNVIGSFYQPHLVLIDPDVLKTLPKRHFQSGLVEAIKMGLIRDPKLFKYFQNGTYPTHIEDVIYRSLMVKKHIVEEDEFDRDIRHLLNFGHTIGHALESINNLDALYHGEAVGLGMIPMITNEELQNQVIQILKSMGLPTKPNVKVDELIEFLYNDKKIEGEIIHLITVNEIGKPSIVPVQIQDFIEKWKGRM